MYMIYTAMPYRQWRLSREKKNILQLCEYIKFRSKDHAVIVMGDTNCRYTRTGDNIRELIALGL